MVKALIQSKTLVRTILLRTKPIKLNIPCHCNFLRPNSNTVGASWMMFTHIANLPSNGNQAQNNQLKRIHFSALRLGFRSHILTLCNVQHSLFRLLEPHMSFTYLTRLVHRSLRLQGRKTAQFSRACRLVPWSSLASTSGCFSTILRISGVIYGV